jgi:AcrR family transcriptional regulator
LSSVPTQPAVAQGAATRERILDAVESLLLEHGLEGFSVAKAAREAGVSNGSVYWQFDSRDALLQAVLDRQLRRLRDRAALRDAPERWDGLDLERAIGKVVDDVINVMRAEQPLVRIFVHRRTADPVIDGLIEEHVEVARQRLAAGLGRFAQEVVREDPQAALAFVCDVILAVVERQAAGRGPCEWDRLRDDLVNMAMAYLNGR